MNRAERRKLARQTLKRDGSGTDIQRKRSMFAKAIGEAARSDPAREGLAKTLMNDEEDTSA